MREGPDKWAVLAVAWSVQRPGIEELMGNRLTKAEPPAWWKLRVALIIVGFAALGCSSDDDDGASTGTEVTAAPADGAAPDEGSQASVEIACERGESLSDLDADLDRIAFVPDDAPDGTSWVDIVVTVDNPTENRVMIDPGFEVTYFDTDGAEIARQPWIDETSDPVLADIVEAELTVDAGRATTQRVVVFEEYSGPAYLRDAQTAALDSLESCSVTSEPTIVTAEPYEPPSGITLSLGECAPAPDGTLVQADLTATNDGEQSESVTVEVAAEVLDNDGNRVGTIGTLEGSLSIPPGETVERTLYGNAAYIDLDTIAGCELYFAELTDR